MSHKNVSGSLLRRVLLLDAVASGGMGLLMAGAAGPLAPLLGLEPGLLRGAGLALIPFALVVAYLGARATLPAWPVWCLVAVNLLWVADSVLLLVASGARPTGLGVLFVGAQALAVAAFSALEYAGMRRGAVALA